MTQRPSDEKHESDVVPGSATAILDRRRFLAGAAAATVGGGLARALVDSARAADESFLAATASTANGTIPLIWRSPTRSACCVRVDSPVLSSPKRA